MSADQPEITSRSRYPGSKPFTTAQKDLFFGRDNDIRNLHSMVLVKQLVVLYGKSGFGKSSLINAGIVPKLITENKYQCFSVRFNNFHTNDINNKMPVETVIDWIKSSSPINFKSPLTILTHGENTFWYWIKTLQWNNRSQPFILFFDQFEELFTYPPAEIEAFSKNLAEVLYIPIPVKYRNELAILDEKGELEDDFHDFLYDIPNIKIVLSIRSDRLSLLNNLTEQHSSIFQNCYELAPLTKKQAEEAIDKPSQLTGDYDTPSFQYTREAILKVINGIASKSDGTIETAMLQILCIYVEDILVLGQKKFL
ncbi:ATP-binding protein [Dyadobacter sp. NIV53]|uniref:ATP-binding protein n=1 Tax=Dyadobacter sp. NIV53 TaxID=2861765 RepID=UPI001C8729E6|nr:ATP-binding protein [Dyadobacter sp. NIV53]